jgi:hypothetical protein
MRARPGPPPIVPAGTLSLFFTMAGTPAFFATNRHFKERCKKNPRKYNVEAEERLPDKKAGDYA